MGFLDPKPLTPAGLDAAVTALATNPASALATAQNATYAKGGGASRVITGPTLPTLPAGTEYVWNKTNGAGTLLDILTGVA